MRDDVTATECRDSVVRQWHIDYAHCVDEKGDANILSIFRFIIDEVTFLSTISR